MRLSRLSSLLWGTCALLCLHCSSKIPVKGAGAGAGVDTLDSAHSSGPKVQDVSADLPVLGEKSSGVTLRWDLSGGSGPVQVTVYRKVSLQQVQFPTASDTVAAQGVGLKEAAIVPGDSGVDQWIAFLISARDEKGDVSEAKFAVRSFRAPCPAGYARIHGNFQIDKDVGERGVTEFCVAKFEMRAVTAAGVLWTGRDAQHPFPEPFNAEARADSRGVGLPWAFISRDDAKRACEALGSEYALVSNAQWQALGEDVLTQEENWITVSVASGSATPSSVKVLPRGHSSGTPNVASAVLDSSGNVIASSKPEFGRALKVASGESVFDVAGNLYEMVADDPKDLGLELPKGKDGQFVEFSELPDASKMLFAPSMENGVSLRGFGKARLSDAQVLLRGGAWYLGDASGVFSVDSMLSSNSMEQVGFRCVFAPKRWVP